MANLQVCEVSLAIHRARGIPAQAKRVPALDVDGDVMTIHVSISLEEYAFLLAAWAQDLEPLMKRKSAVPSRLHLLEDPPPLDISASSEPEGEEDKQAANGAGNQNVDDDNMIPLSVSLHIREFVLDLNSSVGYGEVSCTLRNRAYLCYARDLCACVCAELCSACISMCMVQQLLLHLQLCACVTIYHSSD
jgi:hypothetical protein